MEQTSLNIGTIGQQLEAARNAKGITIKEAGNATKILSKFIEAMENDDFGALSAPVYAKSFIKMYARYLGIDANPLVDEYVAQHAPKAKPQLSDEVRQNLAADQVDSSEITAPVKESGPSIFGNVDKVIPGLSGTRLPPMKYILAGVGVLVLLLILISAKQCADDQDEAPAAAGGAASAPREQLIEGSPDLYLVKPGVVEMGK